MYHTLVTNKKPDNACRLFDQEKLQWKSLLEVFLNSLASCCFYMNIWRAWTMHWIFVDFPRGLSGKHVKFLMWGGGGEASSKKDG